MTPARLELTFLGYHWPWSGDLFETTHEDGRRARVYVDSIGETWVDVRRIPEGGWFPTERVEAWRAFGGSEEAYRRLRAEGFGPRRHSRSSSRVRERD